MTVSSSSSRIAYVGDGTTTAFAFPYEFSAGSDLKVYKAGVLQTITTHYTVSGGGGGTVTFVTAPAANQSIVIYDDPPATQLLDYIANDPFPAESHEGGLDKLTRLIRRLKDRMDRAMRLSDSDVSGASVVMPTPSAQKILGWNAAANALVNYSASDLTTVAAYAAWQAQRFNGDGVTVNFTLSSDPGNVNNMDVSIGGVTQQNGTDFTVSGTTLTFTSAPPVGTNNIFVRWGQALPQSVTDATAVSYTAPGAGASNRSAYLKLSERISVEDFGADATGTSPANTAFTNAAQAVLNQGGGDLYAGPGEFLLLDWALPAGVRLVGKGRNHTLLRKNGGGIGTYVIKSEGTVGASSALAANASAGAFSVQVADASHWSVGAWALLRENTYVSGSAGRKQQILRVLTVNTSTDVVTFTQPLFEAYTTAAVATLHVLSGITDAGLYDLALEGVNANNSGGCLRLLYPIEFGLEGVGAQYYSDGAAFELATAYGTHGRNLTARDGINTSSGGYGYAVSFDEACAFSSMTHSRFENSRECTYTNRTTHCEFSHNWCVGMYDSGFNTHGAFVTHCKALDNDVVGTVSGSGIAVGFSTHTAGDTDILVANNRIRMVGGTGLTANAPVAKENLRITFRDNTVYGAGYGGAGASGMLVQRSNGVRSSGNIIDGVTNNVAAGVYVLNCSDGVFDHDTVRNLPNGYGFRYADCTDVDFNVCKASEVSSNNFRGEGANTRVFVNGRIMDDTSETVGTGGSHAGRIQRGRHTVTFAGTSTKTEAVTFPAAYPAGTSPVVIAVPENELGNWSRTPLDNNPTNTGFQLTLVDEGGTARTGTVDVHWVAIG